jgi:PhoPQ-activated pathogenicity-related protein
MIRSLVLNGFLAFSVVVHASERTALDDYIDQPDPNYSFKRVRTIPGNAATAYVLEMTSQQWLTEKEVDRPIWKHWVTIIKPTKVSTEIGLLFIGGGANGRAEPDKLDQNLARVAVATQSIVTELRMVPNQPLTFAGEQNGRVEDSLIAYSWDKFLRTGDTRWPARLPMTKSAVRALDTITAFCATDEGGNAKVEKFVVAGGSKRGWTAWSTAAVDKRIVGIVPIVIDMLNVVPSFNHHHAAYGFWAPAVDDYVAMGIMDWMNTPEFAALMKIEEPYEYRERFTMPKLLINSAGDQFFLPD